MTKGELKRLLDGAKSKLPYFEKALERDSIYFKWKSNSPDFKLPFQPEMLLTTNGALGYSPNLQKWVVGSFNEIRDEYGDFVEFVGITLDTREKLAKPLVNHKEVIVCGNTPLYRSFNDERSFYSYIKSETDKSIICQLINSRLNKAIVVDSDQKKKQIETAYEAVKLGFPMVLVTSLLETLDTVDLTDPDDIEKMQYLNSFYQTMEKREANDSGVDLELIDKRAQLTSNELKQYDDITTLEYLIMYEMRLAFVEEMKENGYDIEIIPNPIFFDEPKKEDVEEGAFEEAEAEEEETPEENEEEETDNGNNDN